MTTDCTTPAVRRIRRPFATLHPALVRNGLPTEPTAAASTPRKDNTR